nr:adenylate/guanylate cyclase domain-containing protein [Pigmentibacter ruber]
MLQNFSAKNRKKLFEITSPIWEKIKNLGYSEFSFQINDGTKITHFLSVNQPEYFGENVSYQPLVIAANMKGKTVYALEQGQSGYGFRTISPMFLNGKHLGSIELSVDIGKNLLNLLIDIIPGSWGIYKVDRGIGSLNDKFLLASNGDDIDGEFKNILPPENILNNLKINESFIDYNWSAKKTSLYLAVINSDGKIALILKYVHASNIYNQILNMIIFSVVICFLSLFLSSGILLFLNHLISNPIRKLVKETEKIGKLQLDDEINFSNSLKEIDELIESTKKMKVGLRSFQKYVPATLVRQLIETKQEAIIEGTRKNITVFFSDVADFTSISETLTPNELTAQLSEYFNIISNTIIKYNGTVDKYIGDAVMAFWGAPIELTNHAELACKAALECQLKCEELNINWKKNGKKEFKTRIGINSGDIIVGNIGTDLRLSYTIIGDEVNLASRLESLNKTYGTKIIVSQNTVDQLPDDFALRVLDYAIVKGKTLPVTIYELVAEKGDIAAIELELLKTFNKSIELYKEKRWDEAIELLEDLLIERPTDNAIRIFIKRCTHFKEQPPPNKWRGEFIYSEK